MQVLKMYNRFMYVSMQQVHGNRVVRVYKKDLGKIIKNCDGLITNDKGLVLQVRTADCLPISFIDKNNTAIGLVHAGWRGLQKQIIIKTVDLMVKSFGTNLKDIKIEIGTHICKKHYEVGPEVSKYFKGEKYLDLAKIAINQLTSCGVLIKNIKIDRRCTYEDKNLPSYRRDSTSERIFTKLPIDMDF